MALGRRKSALRVYSPERAKGRNRLREDGLTASGQRQNRKGAEQQRQVRQPWQARAFYFYDELGVIKYASQFYSRPLSKLRLYAAEKDDKGELQPTENQDVIAQVERIQDPGGGTSQLLSAYGRLAFLAGESVLFVSNDEENGEQWEFLSADELRVEPGEPARYSRVRAPSLNQESYLESPADSDYEPVKDNEAMAYRIWTPHPRFSHLADSPMRGVLDIAEELMILTRSIRATARSRIANRGILLIPDSVGPKPLEGGPDEDAQEDPFLAEFIEAVTAAILDEASASALAPVVIRGDAEALDKVRHVQLVEPTMLYPETGVRTELIHRLAIELDMPVEALEGNQNSNHWNAWMVDEQAWKDHQEPIAVTLCDNLPSAFLRPTLKAANVPDWAKYRIAYDATDVVVHPDRSKDARELYDRIAIGDRALREANGFTDDDAPTEEEARRQIGIILKDSSLAADNTVGRITGGTIETAPGVLEKAAPGDSTSTDVEKGAPQNGSKPSEPTVAAAAIIGAAEIVMHRARQMAGAKLRSLAKRDPEVARLLDGIESTKIAAALGPERATALRAPAARELVAGVAELLGETLKERGLKPTEIAFLGEQIEHHAARTLFEEKPVPLPAAFSHFIVSIQAGQ